jgi:hypothetical protein
MSGGAMRADTEERGSLIPEPNRAKRHRPTQTNGLDEAAVSK